MKTICCFTCRKIKALGFLSLLLGLVLFQARTAHSIPVRIDAGWHTSGAPGDAPATVLTEAFFDTGTLTGVGLESVPLDGFNLTSINGGFGGVTFTAPAILDPASPDFLGGLTARYNNGGFIAFGGSANLSPLGAGRVHFQLAGGLNHRFGSGIRRYSPAGSPTIISLPVPGVPVPEPSTMLLLGSGLVGLIGYNYRRGKQTI